MTYGHLTRRTGPAASFGLATLAASIANEMLSLATARDLRGKGLPDTDGEFPNGCCGYVNYTAAIRPWYIESPWARQREPGTSGRHVVTELGARSTHWCDPGVLLELLCSEIFQSRDP